MVSGDFVICQKVFFIVLLFVQNVSPFAYQYAPLNQLQYEGNFFASCNSPELSLVIFLLRLVPKDVKEAQDAMKDWSFDGIANTLFLRGSQIESEDIYTFSLIERYLPPDEFLVAVSALTLEQKGHIEQLGLANRRWELERIMDGIILSLPDEIQIKSRNFTALLKTLSCIQSSLQGYQRFESQ